MKITHRDRKFIREVHSVKKWTEVKTVKDLPKEVIKTIKLVSLSDQKMAKPFGSYMNRISDYFGDIDAIQIMEGFTDLKDLGSKTASAVQKVVREIKKLPDHWFSEFKAGIDAAYYFDYGTCREGVYRINPDLSKKTEILYGMGLLSKRENEVIQTIAAKKVGNGDDYDAIFNIFRDHFILRWTEQEIKQGWKKISTGKYPLAQAVLDRSVVKIDMIVKDSSGKFIEVTNFIVMGLGKGKYLQPILDLSPLTLPQEIEKFYYSNFFYKPFKMVKRCYAYLKWARQILVSVKEPTKLIDEAIANYVEILSQTINILYTVNSEVDAIINVLKKDKSKATVDKVNKRLDMMKEPISNVLEFDRKNLSDSVEILDLIIAEKNIDKKIEDLGLIKIAWNNGINFWTVVYLDHQRVNPPPPMVLGLKKDWVYNHDIKREPWDVPLSEMTKYKTKPLLLGGSWFGDLAKKGFQKAVNFYRSKLKELNEDGNPKSRQLHFGELHLPKHNFTGPGTRIDLDEVREYPPYNDVDSCSRTHDFDYEKAIQLPDGERQKAIIEADKKAVNCYKKFPDQDGSRLGQLGLNSKMSLGQVLPKVSNALFGVISSGKGGRKIPKRKGGRTVSSVEQVKDPRLMAPGSKVRHLRPGENPDIAKQAFKTAAKIVTSALKEDPKGVLEGLKQVGTDLGDILSGKNLEPGWKYDSQGRIVQIKKGGCNKCQGTCGGKTKDLNHLERDTLVLG